MVFSNLVFLFAFLPIVLFFYFIVKPDLKNIVLLIASLLFYAWGEPQYVFLMLFSILINYLFGLGIDKFNSNFSKKMVLWLSIFANLGILGYFKYSGFLIENINSLFNLSIKVKDLPLPIGISFFTFQAMSYVIDVYRKSAKVQKNLYSLALYISLFPQLVAGPIVRYNDVDEQITKRTVTPEKLKEGIQRFVIGLGKKVLLANGFASIADSIFSTPADELSVLSAWVGITAYTLQIYFDFSGYSDMAIGLGKMFGFDFLENFNYPYISKNVSEFWRRWHMSLGNWFKDYLYFPLGGNRTSKVKAIRNLLIVWTATGFWHGASWTFMAWGFYYGILIVLEKYGFLRFVGRLWTPLQHIYTLLIVMIGWVFFRADNFSYSLEYLQRMFSFSNVVDQMSILFVNDNWGLFLLGILFSMPVLPKIKEVFKERPVKNLIPIYSLASTAMYMLILVAVMMFLVNSTYNPFIYFRF